MTTSYAMWSTASGYERRANEYWANWHNSAFVAGDYQRRAEAAEGLLRQIMDVSLGDPPYETVDGAEMAIEDIQGLAHRVLLQNGSIDAETTARVTKHHARYEDGGDLAEIEIEPRQEER